MTNTPETPALPGDLTDETIERAAAEAAALATELREHMRQQKWMPAGLAIRAADLLDALAAARVAPAKDSGRCGGCRDLGPHRNVPGCDYYEPEAAPITPSPDREKLIRKLRAAVRGEIDGTTIPVPVEDCRAIAAALAVPPVVNEAPTPVTIARAQRGGKTSALVDAVLAAANERGITVTIVPPLVNEAKLAEIIDSLEFRRHGTTDKIAAALVERQREWLA